MKQNILDLDPQKQRHYIDELLNYSKLVQEKGLISLEGLVKNNGNFLDYCLLLILKKYKEEDLSIVINQKVNSIISYIDSQLNLIVAGVLAVYSQKSEKIVDLTIKSHNYYNTDYTDESYLACCYLLKNWNQSIVEMDKLNLCLSVKQFCLYAQDLFENEINPGDCILLLNQKKMTMLKTLRQTFDIIVMGVISIHLKDETVLTKHKLDCMNHLDLGGKFKKPLKQKKLAIKKGFAVKKEISVEFVLRSLNDDAIQKVLKEINKSDLAMLLSNETNNTKELIYKNMTNDEKNSIKSKIKKDYLSEDIERVQLYFIQSVFQYIEKGNLILSFNE